MEELERENFRIYQEFGEWQSNYLLNQYFVVQKITDKSLTLADCFDYIQSLSECIEFWGNIKNPDTARFSDEIKEYIDKINFFSSTRRRYYRNAQFVDYSYLNVFMLACFKASKNDDKKLLKFLKTLEKYLFVIEFFDGEAMEDVEIKFVNWAEIVIKLNKGDMVINGVIDKLEKTLFDSHNSDEYRIKGDLLYASLHLIQKGMKEVTVDNYYDGTKMTIELDERFDGKTNANHYYNKYQKAKNSLKVLEEQIEKTKEEINYFDTLNTLMDNADYYDAMEIKEELENYGYIRKKNVKKLKKKTHPHYDVYRTRDGIIIYVGKNNLQNDYLTFKMASRNDMWFHVKDMPGSHIIVHAENLDEYTMRLAANIAAYFSKGKYSSSVPVNYCLVKNLKKPHTNKPGLVLLGHYKTIYIDPDDSFYDELEKVEDAR